MSVAPQCTDARSTEEKTNGNAQMNTYRSVTVYAVWARTHLFPKMINVLASTGYITVFEDEVRVINERILERIASRMS